MNDTTPTLSHFRQEIDRIDNQIVDLFKERLHIVKQVGEYKSQHTNDQSFIRSGREASMLRDLVKKLDGTLPPAAVGTIWRMIISSSLATEQSMSIGVYATPTHDVCYWQAREYFGTFLPIHCFVTAQEVIDNVAYSKVAVGVLPTDDALETPWWVRPDEEKNNIFIFARIPFIENNDPLNKPVLAIANVKPEPTEDDVSICAIRSSLSEQEIIDIFAASGLTPTILSQHHGHYLIEVNRFLRQDSKTLRIIETSLSDSGRLRLLGSYASPMKA